MLDGLIVQMLQHFLNSIRPDHPVQVFMNIEEIMTMIIKESEEIRMQLLNILVNILISSVKKENQNVSLRSYVLGEKVLEESAVKLRPHLPKAVTDLGISCNNYSEVVELIWREAIKSKGTGFCLKHQRKQFPHSLLKENVKGRTRHHKKRTMQHNLTPKGVLQNKGVKVDVHGYKVKVSSAPIFTAIFAKYDDIAVNCHNKPLASRASLLDLVCDVVKRLDTSDVGSSSIKEMKYFVSAAVDVKLDVTWLQQYLDEISEEEDMEKSHVWILISFFVELWSKTSISP